MRPHYRLSAIDILDSAYNRVQSSGAPQWFVAENGLNLNACDVLVRAVRYLQLQNEGVI